MHTHTYTYIYSFSILELMICILLLFQTKTWRPRTQDDIPSGLLCHNVIQSATPFPSHPAATHLIFQKRRQMPQIVVLLLRPARVGHLLVALRPLHCADVDSLNCGPGCAPRKRR